MRRALIALALFCLSAHAAPATEPCPSADELWEHADLVALGTFGPSLQKEPLLRCKQENLAYSFGQCPDEIRAVADPQARRVPFHITRILKINQQAAGSYIESTSADGVRTIGLPRVMVNLYAEMQGTEGILFAKEKTPLNDFVFLKCGFIDRKEQAKTLESLLQAHPGWAAK